MKQKNVSLLEGAISVRAAITARSREILDVYVDARKKEKRDRKTLAFLAFLKENGITPTVKPRTEIEQIVQKYTAGFGGSTHGGIVALVGERRYTPYEKLLADPKPGDYFVYLDGVEDPFNLGYSVRTLYAMGATGFLLSKRSWESAAGALARSSAGATELAPIAFAPTEDKELVRFCGENGIDIVCSALSGASIPLDTFFPKKPFLLVIGGEKRGISPELMEAAKTVVHIPYTNSDVRYSLPTASVAALYAGALFPYAAQKNAGKEPVPCSAT